MRTDHSGVLAGSCENEKHINCNNCRLSNLCLPLNLELSQLDQVNALVERNKTLHKGEYLYRAGDVFSAIFAVRSGCIKTVHLSEDGEEQITGFYLPGEILGIDGLHEDKYNNSAIALETSAACQLPFNKLENLSQSIPSLQRHYFQIMSREIISEQKLIALLSKGSAEQRITSLLLSISSRNQRRQLSATEFMLPMSRTDMGNYLGLTVETVSRVFSRLQKDALIKSERRMVQILDIHKLTQLANS